MVRSRTYMDHNATSPLCESARDAMAVAMACVGNPSSVHQEGRSVRALIEDARRQVAASVGAGNAEIVFTSGGSEANALGLATGLAAKPHAVLIVSAVEHPSVLENARRTGSDLEVIPVDGTGAVNLPALEAVLSRVGGNAVISVMYANNETGVVQPVSRIAELAEAHGAFFHVDAIQAAGKCDVSFDDLGAHAMSLSAHKLGGPAGTGALVLRKGLPVVSLVAGGGQETGRRAGTENVIGICGFGAAASDAAARFSDLSGLRDSLEEELRNASADVVIFGERADRLANTSCFAVSGTSAETLVIALDLAGFAVSSGSACSSGKVTRSHVLDAMGVPPDLAEGALRVSLGPQTRETDIGNFVAAWSAAVERQRELAGAAA